jgi:DNA-binding transcriptional ArsR family regulator
MQLTTTPTGDRLDATFAALADPTRRAILARLARGEASVSELAAPFAMSQPAISKHLKVLERAGLVSGARDAQRRPRKLEAAPLEQANDWLEAYRRHWEANYRALDAVLEELKARERGTGTTRRKRTTPRTKRRTKP